MPTKSRIIGFDFLRAFAALGVVAHHFSYWLGGPPLVNFGMYGVYLFFVLGGASTVLAQGHKIFTEDGLKEFFIGRVARLYPLFLLVMLLHFINSSLSLGITLRDGLIFFINSSLMYGWAQPGFLPIIEGGWYLGIEFSFFMVFPILYMLARSGGWWFFALLLYATQQAYITVIFQSGDLKENWVAYTNLISFAFYYFMGMVIGLALQKRQELGLDMAAWLKNIAQILFFGLLAVLIIWSPPYTEETITGAAGKILPLVTVLLVLSGYFLNFPLIINRIIGFIGNCSYGIFLLHPLIFSFVVHNLYFLPEQSLIFAIALALVTILCAHFMLKYFELPMKKWLVRRLNGLL